MGDENILSGGRVRKKFVKSSSEEE